MVADEHIVATKMPQITSMLTEMYDEMISIFGRGDDEMRTINKMLRSIISI